MIQYTRTITDEEQKILENDLLDITEWIDKAILGKLSNCGTRAAQQYDKLAADNNITMIPAKAEDKRAALFAHPAYKNRVRRDQDSKISD